VFILNLEKLHR